MIPETEHSVISDVLNSPAPPPKKKSVLDLSWLSSSEDDAFFKDEIASTSEKSSMKPPSLRKQVLNSSPLLERVLNTDFGAVSDKSPFGQEKPVSAKRMKFTELSEFSDPISSQSVESLPPKPAKKAPKATKSNTKSTDGYTDKQWREANKLKRRKEDILKEMVVEVAIGLEECLMTEHFKEVFELPTLRRSYLEIPLITWKRRIHANYNAEEDVFVPCAEKEVSERVIVLYYEARELVDRIHNESLQLHIDTALRRARATDPLLDYHVVVLVLGFKEYVRKLQAAEDKSYREQMLRKMGEETSTPTDTRRPHTPSAGSIQKLLYLTEVSLQVHIFMTRSVDETIDWLASFTHTIGTSLYDKHERNPEFANFGKARLGSDRKSTFIEMMKKFNLMSHAKAEKLHEFYTSPASIFKRLCEKENLGTVNGKGIVPPSVNSAMRRFFTATDESTVIND